jgi:hypothetical protein
MNGLVARVVIVSKREHPSLFNRPDLLEHSDEQIKEVRLIKVIEGVNG